MLHYVLSNQYVTHTGHINTIIDARSYRMLIYKTIFGNLVNILCFTSHETVGSTTSAVFYTTHPLQDANSVEPVFKHQTLDRWVH